MPIKKRTQKLMKSTKPTRKTALKKNKKANPLTSLFGVPRYRMASFIMLFAIVGASLLWILRAYTPSTSLEAEEANLNTCAQVVSDTTASGGRAVTFNCPTTSGFIHPGVVYTQAEIDSWSTSSPEYTRLKGNYTAKLTTAPIVFGTRIDSGGTTGGDYKSATNELNAGLKDQSGFAKVQAVLWSADGDPARRDKAISYLKEYATVTSIEWDVGEQWRLVSGWGCTNLAQAAEIINYQDAGFRRFLKDVCYPVMDWTTGGNWHASFADSKLAIAAYLGDEELWTDAKAYYYERLAQSIYHSAYDSGFVRPLHTEDTQVTTNPDGTKNVAPRLHSPPGTTHAGRTVGHWGGWGAYPQITTDLKAQYPIGTPFPDGTNAERRRDLGHVNMGLAGWMHGARTILAQGEQLEPHAYARLQAGYSYHAGRVLAYLQTGTVPEPAPVEGIGGSVTQGIYGARKLFGSATPKSVLDVLARPEMADVSPGCCNHTTVEPFADGGAPVSNPVAPITGTITGQFSTPAAGTYRMWVRIKAPDITNNSVQVQINNGAPYKMGDKEIVANTWTWVDYQNGVDTNKVDVTLTQGLQDVTLTGIEQGVRVDKIIIVSNPACIPTGDGTNCTNPPNLVPNVVLTLPPTNATYTAPASIAMAANASDNDGTISKVEFYSGSTKVGEDTTSPYSFNWTNVAADEYSITAKATDNQGASKISSAIGISVIAPPPPDSTPIAAPTNFKVKSLGNGTIELVWDKSADTRVDEYMLRYSRTDSSTVSNYSTWTYPAHVSENTITITGLTNNKSYYFQVRAIDSDGSNLGSYTDSLQATPRKKWWFF